MKLHDPLPLPGTLALRAVRLLAGLLVVLLAAQPGTLPAQGIKLPGPGTGAPKGGTLPGMETGILPTGAETGAPSMISESPTDPNFVPRALTYNLGEPIQLGPFPELENQGIKDIYFSRALVVGPARLERGAQVYRCTAQRLGITRITFIGWNNKQKQIQIRIVPDLKFVRAVLERQFPRAALRINSAGDNILYVEGTVDAPGDVDAIVKFLQGFVDANGKVVNGIQIVGPQQVQLEVCIAEVNRTAMRQMGVNYLRSDGNGFLGQQVGSVIGVPTIRSQGVNADGGGHVFSDFNSTASTATTNVLTPASTLFFGVTQMGSAFYGFLNWLRQEELAKVLATPTLVTLNGRPADFLVGGEIPFVTAISGGGGVIPNVDFKPFGTRLTFIPLLLGDGRIRLEVLPEVSQPTVSNTVIAGGIAVPSFVTQRLRATVELQNGQTLALGGLLQTTETATVNKIPFLGDIPYVGTLFRTVAHTRTDMELLILVTPHLVDPLRCCQRVTAVPGTETLTPTDRELFLYGEIEVPPGHPGPVPHPTPEGPPGGPAFPAGPGIPPALEGMPPMQPVPPMAPLQTPQQPEMLPQPQILRPVGPAAAPQPTSPPGR